MPQVPPFQEENENIEFQKCDTPRVKHDTPHVQRSKNQIKK